MECLTFAIEPVAPFRLDLTAWALRRRAENIMDRWDGTTYRRVLVVQELPVEVQVTQTGSPDMPHLQITATGAKISGSKPLLISVLTQMLGTSLDLSDFYRFAEQQPKLNALVRQFRGFKPPRFPTLFEAMVNAVACQQLSLTVGILVLSRLASAFGASVSKQGERAFAFPSPETLSTLDWETLRPLGFSLQKARAVIELASSIAKKQLNPGELEKLGTEAAVERLRKLRGIGRWSAEYVLLRGLGRLNVFPADDVGARNKLKDWLDLQGPLDYEGVRHSISSWKAYGGLIYLHLLLKGLSEAGFL